MNLIVLFIIKSTDIGEVRYRTVDLQSGLIKDLDYNTVLNNNIDISKATTIEIKNINTFSGRLKTGLNDLETYCRLNNMLDTLADYNRANNSKKANEIAQGSIQEVDWVCSKGHRWSTPIKSRTGKIRSGCPECARVKGRYHTLNLGDNDLETWCIKNNRKDLLLEYSSENKLKPNEIAAYNSSVETLWICSKCGNKFSNRVGNRTHKGQDCPLCAKNGSSIPEATIYLYLSNFIKDIQYRAKINKLEADIFSYENKFMIDYRGNYWHLDRQELDNKKVEIFKQLGIHTIIINHQFNLSNKHEDDIISYNGKDTMFLISSICSILKIEFNKDLVMQSEELALHLKHSKSVINSVAETHPKIKEKWDYEKNLGLTPENFTYGTKYKAWFKCPKCGHSYYSYIRKQATGQECPLCSKGADSLEGINDLATTHPFHNRVWDFGKNEAIGLYPNKVKAGSIKEAYFKCPECKYEDSRQIRLVFKNPWYRCKNCKTKTPLE